MLCVMEYGQLQGHTVCTYMNSDVNKDLGFKTKARDLIGFQGQCQGQEVEFRAKAKDLGVQGQGQRLEFQGQ